MSVRDLLPYQQQILEALGSTAFAPVSSALQAFVAHEMDVATRQAQAAAKARQARQERIDAAVLGSLGPLPAAYENKRWLVGKLRRRFERSEDCFGLGHVPCDRTIRLSLGRLEQFSTSETEVAHRILSPISNRST